MSPTFPMWLTFLWQIRSRHIFQLRKYSISWKFWRSDRKNMSWYIIISAKTGNINEEPTCYKNTETSICIDFILTNSLRTLRISPYSVRMQENAGKVRTRITPNTDNFYAVVDTLKHPSLKKKSVRANCALYFTKTLSKAIVKRSCLQTTDF